VTENEALADLIGNRVRVWALAGNDCSSDEGILEVYDDPWVRIRTDAGEILCFPVHMIRLLKLTRRLKPLEPRENLLRPASPEEQAGRRA
jgi:hypothetical protein